MTAGERVRLYRERRQWTQETLAGETGIVKSSISKIEHGTRKVTLDEAVLLAEVLEVRLDDLAGTVPSQAVRADILKRHVQEARISLVRLDTIVTALEALGSTSF